MNSYLVQSKITTGDLEGLFSETLLATVEGVKRLTRQITIQKGGIAKIMFTVYDDRIGIEVMSVNNLDECVRRYNAIEELTPV